MQSVWHVKAAEVFMGVSGESVTSLHWKRKTILSYALTLWRLTTTILVVPHR